MWWFCSCNLHCHYEKHADQVTSKLFPSTSMQVVLSGEDPAWEAVIVSSSLWGIIHEWKQDMARPTSSGLESIQLRKSEDNYCETAAMSFARATRRPPLRPESPQATGKRTNWLVSNMAASKNRVPHNLELHRRFLSQIVILVFFLYNYIIFYFQSIFSLYLRSWSNMFTQFHGVEMGWIHPGWCLRSRSRMIDVCWHWWMMNEKCSWWFNMIRYDSWSWRENSQDSLYLKVKPMVSCIFPLTSLHWLKPRGCETSQARACRERPLSSLSPRRFLMVGRTENPDFHLRERWWNSATSILCNGATHGDRNLTAHSIVLELMQVANRMIFTLRCAFLGIMHWSNKFLQSQSLAPA